MLATVSTIDRDNAAMSKHIQSCAMVPANTFASSVVEAQAWRERRPLPANLAIKDRSIA
jgi:hypothetical protein